MGQGYGEDPPIEIEMNHFTVKILFCFISFNGIYDAFKFF